MSGTYNSRSSNQSYADSGEVGSTDTTQVAAKYAMEAGGAKVTLGVVSGTTEAASQDIDSSVVGVTS
jgi:hypothetical protein